MSEDILRAQKIIKEYPQGERHLRVLREVSLALRKGEFLSIVGASGSGKSTLLHILGLLDRPTSGDVLFDDAQLDASHASHASHVSHASSPFEGRNLTKLTGVDQSRLRNQLFGFVFQFFHLLPDFNAVENVLMPAMVQNATLPWMGRRREAIDRAESLLKRVGLDHRLKHRPNQLSGGECQRVAICRALMNSPRILLLDEPTGNLDSHTGDEIHQLFRDLHEEGQSIVMVTHDETAAKRTQRILRLRDGQIVS